MKIENVVLEILVNGFGLFLLFSSFVNIDLLKLPQIIFISLIVMNGYFINKKVLREEKCNVDFKQIGVAAGIGFANLLFLILVRKLF